jgi:hypothetical protein
LLDAVPPVPPSPHRKESSLHYISIGLIAINDQNKCVRRLDSVIASEEVNLWSHPTSGWADFPSTAKTTSTNLGSTQWM